jgi:hypothetical protein
MPRIPNVRVLRTGLRALALAAGCGALLALAAPKQAAAQDTVTVREVAVPADSLREIRLTDGSRIYGRIVEETAERVVVVTPAGARIELARGQIESISQVQGTLKDGKVWPADPHATRLFLGPTGRSLAAGEGYAGDFELFVPFVALGVTDRITIGAATVVGGGETGKWFALVPKVQVVRSPVVNVAVGAAAGFKTEDVGSGTVGMAFAVATLGSTDHSLTLGTGFPFYHTEDGSDFVTHPVVQFGGEARVGAHTKLITENYWVPQGEGALLSGGLRIFGEHLSVDAGIGTTTSGGVLPLVNFVYSWGGRKK